MTQTEFLVSLVDPFLDLLRHEKNYQNSRIDRVEAKIIVILKRQREMDVISTYNIP